MEVLEARNGGVEVREVEERSLSEPLSQSDAEEGQDVLATGALRGAVEGTVGGEDGGLAIRSVPRDSAHVAEIHGACRSVRGGGCGSRREHRERKNCQEEEGGGADDGDGSGRP